jgi:hypothetical protein
MNTDGSEGRAPERAAGARADAGGAQDVAAAWARMTDTMARTVQSTMDLNARNYRRMMEAWSGATGDIAARMGALDRADPDVAEAWNVWRNYSARLARRMDGAARSRREALERMGRDWAAASAELGARVADAEASGSAMAFEAAYRAWVDFSSSFMRQLGEGIGAGGREVGDLATVWSDFTRDMGAAMARLEGRSDAAVEELGRAWASLARTMGERVSRDSAQVAGDMMELHAAWARQSDEMGRLMRGTMRRLEAELEQLARDYGGSSACLACESSFERYRGEAEGTDAGADGGAGAEGDDDADKDEDEGEEESADEHGWAEEVARLGARVEELERELAVARAAPTGGRLVTGIDDPNRTRS